MPVIMLNKKSNKAYAHCKITQSPAKLYPTMCSTTSAAKTVSCHFSKSMHQFDKRIKQICSKENKPKGIACLQKDRKMVKQGMF